MAPSTLPHILVVDDEADVADLFRQKFRRQIRSGEIHFVFAQNGREALEKLRDDPAIGLVFTDLNMPEMDGLELLEHIHHQPERLLKTVVISAYGDLQNIRRAMNAGAMDFIVKPIDLDDLAVTLSKANVEWQAARDGLDAQHRAAVVEEAKRLQKEFFDNVTHELRTPLTLLLGLLESAADLQDRDAMLRELELSRKHGRSLLRLIDELLEVARIDAGALELRLAQVEMKGFLRELGGSFAPLARSRQIDFEFDPETGDPAGAGPLWMDVDPGKLRRALGNLLANAFKFAPVGGRVVMGMAAEGEDTLRIWVQDNGPGIAENELERVFDRFYRASEGQGVRGTGIGLALVRELVQLHGGQIRASSPGGARFELSLPVTRAAERAEALAGWSFPFGTEMEAADDERIAPNETAAAGDRPLLLLVEDHPDMRQLIRRTIDGEFRVIEAENGLRGLEIARAETPDLILSDLMMPEMDGRQLLRALRTDPATSHIPLVLLTARAQPEARLEGLQTGADAYLTKPFDREELSVVLRNLLDARRRTRERFREELLLSPRPGKQLSVEEQFLHALRKVMDAHLSDELFGVEEMASELGMSRKTLHRKLTAVAGQTPNQFIRRYRLEAAMQMLRDKTGPIGEIAFMTGFSSHSYFSKCFLEYFRISPSEVE